MQLLKIKELFLHYDTHYASTSLTIGQDLSLPNYHVVPDANLDKKILLIYSAISIFFLLVKLRPKLVITTGAAPGFISLVFAKMIGAKTIWIDSIANSEELSLSGKMAKRWADLWLTQWPDLATPTGPYYIGSVV